MHDLQRINTNRNGLMLYRCMKLGCGEEAKVALAGSRAWRENPLHRVRNTILGDGRLRRVEVAFDCPAAPAGIDALKTQARRRRRANRYSAGALRAA